MSCDAPLSSVIRTAWRLLLVAGCVAGGFCRADAADRIVLRNLKIITDQTVVGFDEDGVRLADATMIGWDEIERATIASERQAEFNRWLTELGEPLFRVGQRLRVGDYAGALPHAEALAPRYRGRTSDTAYLVAQSLMWGRLSAGQREAALVPYLECYDILRKRGTTQIKLPGERRLNFDPRTALTPELAPVWFDHEAAKAALPDVLQTVRAMKERPEGAYLYFASLALAAGDEAAAERVLQGMRGSESEITELREILTAQREVLGPDPAAGVNRLRKLIPLVGPKHQALAWYWLGRGALRLPDHPTRQQGVLDLLRIPALWGRSQPELSAAALYEASRALNDLSDLRGSVAVRGELLSEYGNSYHARLLNGPDRAKSQP